MKTLSIYSSWRYIILFLLLVDNKSETAKFVNLHRVGGIQGLAIMYNERAECSYIVKQFVYKED